MSSKIIINSFQTPNQYVDIAMELLSGEEYKCLSFAARHILGWQDKINSRRGRISLSMFERGYQTEDGTMFGGTGLSRPTIVTAAVNLNKYRLLVKVGEPTNDGQEYELGQSPDWAGLLQRRDEKLSKSRQQTEAARAAKRRGQSHKPAGSLSDKPAGVSPTNQQEVCQTNQQGLVEQTTTGLSDKQNQNHSQNHSQKQEEELPPPRQNAFSIYESEIGLLTPSVAEKIKDWLTRVPPEWVDDAIKEAALHNKRSWAYAEKILKRWETEGRVNSPAAKANGAATPASPSTSRGVRYNADGSIAPLKKQEA